MQISLFCFTGYLLLGAIGDPHTFVFPIPYNKSMPLREGAGSMTIRQKQWQKENGLTPDGIAGDLTRRQIQVKLASDRQSR